ncbi:hypothetical protein V8E36_001691 [Tilletia maclaganii]
MLVYVLWIVAGAFERAGVAGLTVPLQLQNQSFFFHANGSIDMVRLQLHSRLGRCRHRAFQDTAPQDTMCRSSPRINQRRYPPGHIPLQWDILSSAPVGTISFGRQPFNVLFDTSARLSVVDPAAYQPSMSDSSFPLASSYSCHLPDGRTTEVQRWSDVVSLGGFEILSTIGRARDSIFAPTQTIAQGLCALSRHEPTSRWPLPVIYEMKHARVLPRAIFAFSLSGHGTMRATGPELNIGYTSDRAYRPGTLLYTEADLQQQYSGLWVVQGSLNALASALIFDTGRQFIFVPLQIAQSLFTVLGLRHAFWAGFMVAKYQCSQPPSLVFRIGRSRVTLTQESLLFGEPDHDECTLSVIGEPRDDINLGQPFFSSAYVVFDTIGSGRVGISSLTAADHH